VHQNFTQVILSGSYVPVNLAHELSKTDFELIEKGLNALLNSGPDPELAEKIKDLRSMFMDAYTGWLEIEDEAA
jgi:hypothetical protein